jgi:hypothetical protein
MEFQKVRRLRVSTGGKRLSQGERKAPMRDIVSPLARKRTWPPELKLQAGMTWEDVRFGFHLGIDDDGYVLEFYRPRFPDEVVDRITRATNVSKRFRRAVGDNVARDVCLAMHEHHNLNLDWAGMGTRTQLRLIGQLSRRLANAIRSLDEAPREMLHDEILPSEFVDYKIPDSMAPCIRLLGRLADAADAAPRQLEKPKRHPWRPRGSIKNPALHHLVELLQRSIVKEADGRLAVRKGKSHGEAKGTLPAVLLILRPYIPDIIPAKLSHSTLRRVLQKVRQT